MHYHSYQLPLERTVPCATLATHNQFTAHETCVTSNSLPTPLVTKPRPRDVSETVEKYETCYQATPNRRDAIYPVIPIEWDQVTCDQYQCTFSENATFHVTQGKGLPIQALPVATFATNKVPTIASNTATHIPATNNITWSWDRIHR